jgi:leucyl aminopeptidase
MTPTIVAERAREIAEQAGIEIEIIERSDAERLGMGSYLSVANGSHQPPKFIVMTYKNDGPRKPIALVGKGITFDTGGTSLKPPGGMESMKYDMSGAATVISAIGAIARLKLKTHVVAIAPCTENMPGGGATKPGDVVYAMDGQSIEVINTDAEGRLVLADGIAYAKKVKNAGVILDVATLTGAMSVSLGDYRIGVFCNQDSLFRQLDSVAQSTGELIWRMPIDDYYSKQIKSEVADLANTGGRLAGSITAAKFIEAFVGDNPWAHFDIAGLMSAKSDSGIHIKGSSGVPTKSLIEYVVAKSAS